MKFTCLKENLSKSLSIVSKAIPLKHSMPILTNVLLTTKDGRLKIAGTNTDTYITTYVGASVEEEGSITVPARLLSEFVSNLSGETVTAHIDNDIFHVISGKTKSKFNGMNADEYPDIPLLQDDLPYIELDPKEFAHALSQVGFAVAVDTSRPVFSGVYINYADSQLTVVGSDGFRLSERVLTVEGNAPDFSVIIPARNLLEISRIFSSYPDKIKMHLNESENLCMFSGEDMLVAVRVIDGAYPDYRRIIPASSKITATFLAPELLEAVKLTHVFAKDSDNILRMVIDPQGTIKIMSSSQETGENHTEIAATIVAELTEPFEIVFNARYMLEFLTNSKFESLIFHANEKTTPCMIKPSEGKDFLHVMAPMHLNG
jgi:DNA polymerase III subunit beta